MTKTNIEENSLETRIEALEDKIEELNDKLSEIYEQFETYVIERKDPTVTKVLDVMEDIDYRLGSLEMSVEDLENWSRSI